MGLVVSGRKWVINSKEDYDNAMNILDDNEFYANMSDDFFRYRSEMDEIDTQRHQVIKQAREKGII